MKIVSNSIQTIRNIIHGDCILSVRLKLSLILCTISFVHLCLLIFFTVAKMPLLVIYNILSIIFFQVLATISKKCNTKLAMFISYGEIFLHAIVATLILGWQCGFMLYIIAVIPSAFYISHTTPDFKRKTLFQAIFTLISLSLFIGCYIFTQYNEANYQIESPWVIPFLYIFNATVTVGTSSLLSLFFISETKGVQQKLVTQNSQLNQMAHIDPLTALLNRRSIRNYLLDSIHHANTHENTFSIILCDIDDFKQINDKFGHNYGDLVLTHIAGILKSNIRETDYACRWGGEEFLILIHESKQASINIAERIRKDISSNTLKFNQANVSLTMTFGIAEYHTDYDIDKLIQLADRRLYYGKSNGKNQVISI